MSLSFDLTREPWIPAETLDGTVVELSTHNLLRDAHRLRGLSDSSPLVVAVLSRHLLAVLHRAYAGPRTMKEWVAIASRKQFDPERVRAYLDTVADRMDLFHPTHPFAQTRGLVAEFADFVEPIDELELARTGWGVGRALFRHRPEHPAPTMSAARATRALLAHHAFKTGGLVKKPNEPVAATAAPLVRAAVVILRGETLFDTLVSNLLRYDPAQGLPIPLGGMADACSWEQPPPPTQLRVNKEPESPVLGYLDLLTWVSRRVELVHDGSVITGFVNAVGKGMAANAPRDPMVTYRRHEERGLVGIGIDPERSFWRDAGALFEAGRDESAPFQRPQAIDLVTRSEAVSVLGESTMFAVEVFGIAAKKSRVDAVRVERVRATARTFDDADARGAVETSLAFAQSVVDALRSALWVFARNALSPGGRDPDTKDIKNLVKSFGGDGAAWSALGVEFDVLMSELADDPDAAAMKFECRALHVARGVFNGITDRPDSSGRWLRARALAEKSLAHHLPKVRTAATPPVAEEAQS